MKNIWGIPVCLLLLQACAPEPESGRGFRLPDGDVERGLTAFTELRCHACHSIEGLDLEFFGTGAADVALGGTVTRVKTYGELVTSIINPSHKLIPGYRREDVTIVESENESLMTIARVNEAMTVQQLIDIVAFLQSHYEVGAPQYSGYDYVYP